MGRLTDQQIAFFHDEGYLIVDDVFDPQDLEPLRGEMAKCLDDKARQLYEAGELKNLYENDSFERRLASIYNESPDCAQQIINVLEGKRGGGFKGPQMFNLITHPSLLDVVESLVGPEIVAASTYRIRPKIPGQTMITTVPWHQDSAYFSELCDKHLILTCWVPLVDANEQNGCMHIAPRSHRRGLLTHHTSSDTPLLTVAREDLPPVEHVIAEAAVGDVVFMTNMTPHFSPPNRTNSIRWSVDLRYQSADAPTNIDLLPQSDEESLAEYEIACYAPEADFIVRSHKRPEKVADYQTFLARRQAFDRIDALKPPQRGWTPLANLRR